jgi:hypothetical protein
MQRRRWSAALYVEGHRDNATLMQLRLQGDQSPIDYIT